MSLGERLYRFRSFWIFPLLAIALIYTTAHAELEHQNIELIWLLPIGIFCWTLLEYGLHRFVFHLHLNWRSPGFRDFMNASHVGHHHAPRDPDKLHVHPTFGLFVSALLFVLIFALTRSLFTTSGVLSGIWAGFLYYESVHYRVHLTSSPAGLIAGQRRFHFHHHFVNARQCFGVTSPLWDYVFGTHK